MTLSSLASEGALPSRISLVHRATVLALASLLVLCEGYVSDLAGTLPAQVFRQAYIPRSGTAVRGVIRAWLLRLLPLWHSGLRRNNARQTLDLTVAVRSCPK